MEADFHPRDPPRVDKREDGTALSVGWYGIGMVQREAVPGTACADG